MPASFNRPSSCWRAMTSCRRRRVASPSGSSSPRWRLALACAARLATLESVGYRFRLSSCHLHKSRPLSQQVHSLFMFTSPRWRLALACAARLATLESVG